MRPQTMIAGMVGAVLALSASTAWAELVLLLPARGQVPGSMLSSILDNETRYGVIEAGHTLLDPKEQEGALRQVLDNQPDTADEFAAMAKFARAEWVVLPTVFQQERSWRLEVIAYHAGAGRTETVARDIDTEHVHQQVVEMLKVLLRPQGVGTDALPWERPAQVAPARPDPSSATAPPQARPDKPPAAAGPHRMFFLGAGLTLNAAASRPSGATGGATSLGLAARAGLSPVDGLDVAVNLADNLSGPRAVMVDGSVRYMLKVGSAVRLGPEVGAGVFAAQGGSQSKSFMVRATAVGSVQVTDAFGVEAHLGDLRWVPASSGTLVLAGASVLGVLRF